MSDPRVIRREEVDSVQRGPGVSVASSVTKEVGATEISSGITTFQAGTSNTTHYHNAEESVIVIEGGGILMINGEENHVRQYDAAFITPGTHHRLINTGEIPFKIAWSYATVDVTRTLVEGGSTTIAYAKPVILSDIGEERSWLKQGFALTLF